MRFARGMAYLAMVAAAWAVPAGAAFAKGRPGGGGGGEAPLDTGIVHFRTGGGNTAQAWTMQPDGSAKSPLPAGVVGAPSRGLLGGHRWLLAIRFLPGETDQGGFPRRELFASRDDGALSVQLTDQADLSAFGDAVWAPGDGSVSWLARRVGGAELGVGQIHAAELVFDADGNVAGLASQPAAPLVATTTDVAGHDWSPDGTRIAYASAGLWIADLATGGTRLLASVGADPAWSPDGARIAYHAGGDLCTIAVDGRNAAKSVVTVAGADGDSGLYGLPQWSPNGTHLVCMRIASPGSLSSRSDVYRFAASGGAGTNLTAELDTRPSPSGGVGGASPQGWR